MPFAIRDVNEARDIAAQIEQGVQFDRCRARLVRRPGKQRQAQIDGGGVQRVDRFLQLDRQRPVAVEPPRNAD